MQFGGPAQPGWTRGANPRGRECERQAWGEDVQRHCEVWEVGERSVVPALPGPQLGLLDSS